MIHINPNRVKTHVLDLNLNADLNKLSDVLKEEAKDYRYNKKRDIPKYDEFVKFKVIYDKYTELINQLDKNKRNITKLEHLLNPDLTKKVIIIKGKSPKELKPEEVEPTREKLQVLNDEKDKLNREYNQTGLLLKEKLDSDEKVKKLYEIDMLKSKKYRMSDKAKVLLSFLINKYIYELLDYAYVTLPKDSKGKSNSKLSIEHFTSDIMKNHYLFQFVGYSEAFRKYSNYSLLPKEEKKKVKLDEKKKEKEEIVIRKYKKEQIQNLKENTKDVNELVIPDCLQIDRDTLSFNSFIKEILNEVKKNNIRASGKKISKDVTDLLSDATTEFLKSFAYTAKSYLDKISIKTINEDTVHLVIEFYINTRRQFNETIYKGKDIIEELNAFFIREKPEYEKQIGLLSEKRKEKKKEKEEAKEKEEKKEVLANGIDHA
jgi:hypothetical protein